MSEQVVSMYDDLPEELQPFLSWQRVNLGVITVSVCPYCTGITMDDYKHLAASKPCFMKLNEAYLQWKEKTRQCQMS